MQKKLLTLAVAGAFAAPGVALAQSSVEVYGTINMAFGNVKYSGSAAGTPSVTKWDVSQGASNFGFRGRESLGGGLTAWFQIESNATMARSNDVSTTPASRNSAVGMQAGWGNVFMGQWTTPWADLDGLWSVGTVGYWGPVTSVIGRRETTGTAPNPNCQNSNQNPTPGAICDQVESSGTPFWRRFSNALFYQSPVVNGMQGKFAYLPNETKSKAGGVGSTSVTSNASAWSGSVQWSGMGGNARAGAAYDSHKQFQGATAGTDTGWSVKGGYNLGIVDIGLAYEAITYKPVAGSCKTTGMAIAAAFPIGSGAIRGSYAKAADLDDAACGPVATNDNGSKEMNIGYDHRFSKRTTVGFGYAKIDNDKFGTNSWTGLPPNAGGAASTTAPGSDVTTFFVTMTHRF